ncbi:MAG: hypothetical protein Mars2KO_32580 [Maribacter sp.]
MNLLSNYFKTLNGTTNLVLDKSVLISTYCPLDLSISNVEIQGLQIQDVDECQKYISTILAKSDGKVAYGGYLEKRNLYDDKSAFISKKTHRNIHLGIDFWTKAGTNVIAPLAGTVHSFRNNTAIGDYGPTIILKHSYGSRYFHTLYGHLSLTSLEHLYVGMPVNKGDTLATLGTPDINVGYVPHLHFQIIENMEGQVGDYPGVCSEDSLDHYTRNCPDPNLLLQIQ